MPNLQPKNDLTWLLWVIVVGALAGSVQVHNAQIRKILQLEQRIKVLEPTK